MIFPRLFLCFCMFSLALCNEQFDSHLLPRPLIVEYGENVIRTSRVREWDDGVQLHCDSWRFAVEANNLNPWKMIPRECAEYVREYIMGRGYQFDLERVSNEAGVYAKSVELGEDGKDVWVFDIDETLLSNLPYYAGHGYGLEIFNSVEFDNWVEKGAAPAIDSSLKLYKEILSLGFKVILLTGRGEEQRGVTEENLVNAGFQNWDKLILRGSEDRGKRAVTYKSEKRSEMLTQGYRIHGNSGDQWSDLLGFSLSNRSFKLPNPMYYIP
ncbi:acid phosphatase 1 [Euphorbia lathyris]|uniref:acid phosphatase 1 n=1 Tax=Euphorbia lathyris TaxID=212925 RepID=UPI0033139A3E